MGALSRREEQDLIINLGSAIRNAISGLEEQDLSEEELFRISHNLCMQFNPAACDMEEVELWGGILRAGLKVASRFGRNPKNYGRAMDAFGKANDAIGLINNLRKRR